MVAKLKLKNVSIDDSVFAGSTRIILRNEPQNKRIFKEEKTMKKFVEDLVMILGIVASIVLAVLVIADINMVISYFNRTEAEVHEEETEVIDCSGVRFLGIERNIWRSSDDGRSYSITFYADGKEIVLNNMNEDDWFDLMNISNAISHIENPYEKEMEQWYQWQVYIEEIIDRHAGD